MFKHLIIQRSGGATLPVVLIVSAIIMEIAITSVLVANVFGNTTFNMRLSHEALATAEAGANDGIIKVIRYCPIGTVAGTGCTPSPYTITVGARTATVIIRDDPDGSGNKIVIASSTILGRVKRVEVRLSINQTTGETDIKSFKECYNYDSAQQICAD